MLSIKVQWQNYFMNTNIVIFHDRKYQELIKSQDMECILRIESVGVQLMDLLCETFRLVCLDQAGVSHSVDPAKSVARAVRVKLADFIGFLKVKAMRNFTLGSYPFRIHPLNI
jgi:Hermansky-Pudlak syndrome 1 protein